MNRHTTALLALAITTTSILALPQPGTAQETAPVVILRSLMTPPEIAQTGQAPEVQIKATIDARGNVSSVDVLSVTPSTEFDPVVVEATKQLIGSWRYAPARTASGEPKETVLQWTMDYSQGSNFETNAPFRQLTPNLARTERDLEIRRMSRGQQSEILVGYAATAERFINKEQRKRIASQRFVVTTDADGDDIARTIAINLEATFNFLDRLFGRDIELMPDGNKLAVYFYGQRSNFLRLSGSMFTIGGNYSGFYSHPGFLAFHQERSNTEELLSTLLHEATHAYLYRYLLEPGVNPGPWFNEGLAEYLGNSTVNRKGEIEIGRAIKGRYVLDYHGGATRKRTGTGWTLDQTKDAIRKGDAPTLGELFLTPYPLFTGERGPLNYGMSWLFVHFLRHGDATKRGSKGVDGDWALTKFPAFLLYLIEGYPPRDAITQVYGMTLSEMNEQFREYAQRF